MQRSIRTLTYINKYVTREREREERTDGWREREIERETSVVTGRFILSRLFLKNKIMVAKGQMYLFPLLRNHHTRAM